MKSLMPFVVLILSFWLCVAWITPLYAQSATKPSRSSDLNTPENMRRKFEAIRLVEKNPVFSPEQKISLWLLFLMGFAAEIPNTQEDNQLRAQANQQKLYWQNPHIGGLFFVLVKGGCFQMGDTFGDGFPNEKPVHEVCVDDFWLGKSEVTQGEWREVMGMNPSYFKSGDNYPVEQVSWEDVQRFIEKLNQQSSGNKYRLPTEAEWEYACRSGGKKERYSGSDSIEGVAWYIDNTRFQSHEVGTKAPNGLGLYDMSGNMWEWTQDWYSDSAYHNHSRNNPARNNPIDNSSVRLRSTRGGSGGNRAEYLRCATRSNLPPVDHYSNLSFRLLRM